MQYSEPLLPFYKYHALGNDYIVLRESDCGDLSPEQIVRICHRHFGIGSDGILLDTRGDSSTFSVRIFNPDGSEAEKSGNGLRIFSRYLWDTAQVSEEAFEIETLGGVVLCRILDEGARVRIAMGTVSFSSDAIGMSGSKREVLSETLELENGERLEISAASIGNPHCIILSDEPTQELASALGPLIESHPSFLAKTNVQFAKVIDRARLQIEIWERGAGYTLASGSSASATAAVVRRLGLVDERVVVDMPGGSLLISIDDAYSVTMEGTVTRVSEGMLFAESFAFASPVIPSVTAPSVNPEAMKQKRSNQ